MGRGLLGFFIVVGIAAAQSSASIQGTLVGRDGRPLSGLFVTASRLAHPPVSETVKSTTTGTFEFDGLPTGTYELCAQATPSSKA